LTVSRKHGRSHVFDWNSDGPFWERDRLPGRSLGEGRSRSLRSASRRTPFTLIAFLSRLCFIRVYPCSFVVKNILLPVRPFDLLFRVASVLVIAEA
jgi:hypothetical protein